MAKKGDQLLTLNALSESKINNIIPIIRTIPNAHIVLCGKDKAFIESKNQHFIDLFQEYYHSYQIVTDVTKITNSGEFLKIAVYHSLSSEKYIYPYVKEFENEVLIKTSSKNWLDISDQQATKGNALIKIQKLLNISSKISSTSILLVMEPIAVAATLKSSAANSGLMFKFVKEALFSASEALLTA